MLDRWKTPQPLNLVPDMTWSRFFTTVIHSQSKLSFFSIFFDWGSPALGLRPFRSQPGWTIHPSTVKSLSFAVLPTSFPLKLPRPTLVTPKNPCKSFHDVLETVTLPVVLGIRPSHSNFAVARALLLGWCANPQLVDFGILGWLWPSKYLVHLVCCILHWNVL